MATKKGYVPTELLKRLEWLEELVKQLKIDGVKFGISKEKIEELEKCVSTLREEVDKGIAIENAKKEQTVKTNAQDGDCTGLARVIAQQVKTNDGYTDAVGKDLGIIGAQQTFSSVEMKPSLKMVIKGGQVEVQWTKGDADSIRIESDKGAGWQFLAVDSVPHYTDTTPITAAATWRYRAMYIVNDELVGQWSDVASIGVGL